MQTPPAAKEHFTHRIINKEEMSYPKYSGASTITDYNHGKLSPTNLTRKFHLFYTPFFIGRSLL